MAKLELKHLAPYLPYGLKVWETDDDGRNYIETVRTIDVLFNSLETSEGVADDIDKFQPILRPLSELENEICVNGKTFIPLSTLLINKYPKWFIENSDTRYNEITIDCSGRYSTAFIHLQANFEFKVDTLFPLHSDYNTMAKLLEWNFDVFDLIEKGLAKNILELEAETSNKVQK